MSEAGARKPKSRAERSEVEGARLGSAGSEGRFADVAQLVEHSLGKGEVISSILIIGSRSCDELLTCTASGWFFGSR